MSAMMDVGDGKLAVKGSTSSGCKGPRAIAVSTVVTMALAPGTGIGEVIAVGSRLQDRCRDLVQCTLISARGTIVSPC
jgi:hypothetical protein